MIKNKLKGRTLLLIVCLLTLGKVATAQQDGANISSPYTIYGIGQINTLGTSANKSMGGAGLALSSGVAMNGLNPAALSSVPSESFLFDFGLQGDNNYISTSEGLTSSNKFNISDIGFQFPIAKRLGFGFVMNPYSSVGYKIASGITNNDLSASVGDLSTLHNGSGGVTQIKASMGWEPLEGFSVGLSALFYHGSITRSSVDEVHADIASSQVFRAVNITDKYQFAKIGGEIGLLYSLKLRKFETLNFAATYQPRLNVNVDDQSLITTTSENTIDTLLNSSIETGLILPDRFAVGVAYSNQKVSVAFDYIFQNYANTYTLANSGDSNSIELGLYQDFRLGFSYTPDRFGVMGGLSRWTYRLGARYGTSYLSVSGYPVEDYSITAGLGIPLERSGFSAVSLGLDFGRRSTYAISQMSETYFKIYAGFNIFVLRDWFIRHKFK